MSECQHCKGYTPKEPLSQGTWVFCDECADVALGNDGEWEKRTDLNRPSFPEETESW